MMGIRAAKYGMALALDPNVAENHDLKKTNKPFWIHNGMNL
jgi:hypothetical protein